MTPNVTKSRGPVPGRLLLVAEGHPVRVPDLSPGVCDSSRSLSGAQEDACFEEYMLRLAESPDTVGSCSLTTVGMRARQGSQRCPDYIYRGKVPCQYKVQGKTGYSILMLMPLSHDS